MRPDPCPSTLDVSPVNLDLAFPLRTCRYIVAASAVLPASHLRVSLRSRCPLAARVAQCLAVGAADVALVVGASDRIEAGGIDDAVELQLLRAGADAALGDPLDRRLGDVHEPDVVAVVRLEVAVLHRHPLHA